jgi:hypothetical protein
MSLINDALTRAKQVPPGQPPPLPLRPVEPAQKHANNFGWIIGITVGVVVLLGVGALMIGLGLASLKARAAKSPEAVSARPAPAPAPVVVVEATPSPATPVAAHSNPETSAAAPVVVPAPAPVMKLQAILFSPARPSAVVNGRTVFVGDQIEGFTVTSITRSTCTLVSKTETNVLELKLQ